MLRIAVKVLLASQKCYLTLYRGAPYWNMTESNRKYVRALLQRLLARQDDVLISSDQATEYNEALAHTGQGKFQVLLIAVCAWALASDSIEILSISFVLVPAEDDLKLTGTDKGLLTAIIFLGMMIGGYLWGSLADIYGRRQVLFMSLSINGLGGLGSSFSPNVSIFSLMRFISGIGVGGSLPVIYSYCMEFQTAKHRGSMVSLLASLWMSGMIICAVVAWLIIPNTWSIPMGSINYNSWRIFLAVCSIPAFTSCFFFYLMPESPRFLLSVGKADLALKVLRKIYWMNNPQSNVEVDYKVEALVPLTDSSLNEDDPLLLGRSSCCARAAITIKMVLSQTLVLFSKPLRRTSIVLIIIYFSISYGYDGLFLWFPELFNHMAKYGGSPCNPGHNATNVMITNTTVPQGSIPVPQSVYIDALLTALSKLPGNIFTVLCIECIKNGRNVLLAISMVVAGLSVFFIALCNSSVQSVIMSCVFGGITAISWNSLNVISVELYPTNLRTTAAGFQMGIGRIASILTNFTFGLLINTFCFIPMLLVASLMTAGGLCAFLLPNRSGQDVDEHPE